jgi:hypothetical protein
MRAVGTETGAVPQRNRLFVSLYQRPSRAYQLVEATAADLIMGAILMDSWSLYPSSLEAPQVQKHFPSSILRAEPSSVAAHRC